MRRIAWLICLLLTAGWLAAEYPLAQTAARVNCETPWRRTRDGWEHYASFAPAAACPDASLHPAVVAAFEFLFCLAVVVALSPTGRASGRTRSFGHRAP